MTQNHVQLIGYVGNHLFSMLCNNGTRKTRIRVATYPEKEKSLNEDMRNTTWHTVIAWGELSDYAQCNFVKGSRILVTGRISYRIYQQQDGQRQEVTEIIARKLTNLDR